MSLKTNSISVGETRLPTDRTAEMLHKNAQITTTEVVWDVKIKEEILIHLMQVRVNQKDMIPGENGDVFQQLFNYTVVRHCRVKNVYRLQGCETTR